MKKLVVCFVLATTPAFAQQQGPNPVEQRLATQIGIITIQNTALSVQVEQQAAEIAKLKAKIEELEKKEAK